LDNTGSLFALFLVLVNPIYVLDVFNGSNVTTFLFDGEIDVPKTGKSREIFTISILLLIVCLSFKLEKMCILKDKYLSNTSKFELFYCPSKDSAYSFEV